MSEQSQLNMQDFQNVVRLIDIAAQRGAINGDELIIIGSLRQKFANFIDQNSKAGEQDAPQRNEQAGEPQTGEGTGEKEYPSTEG